MSNYNIYPKQFRNAKIPIEKNRCFVLMPFKDEHDATYGAIKKSLVANDYVCNRADEIFGSVPIIGKVLKEIIRSHFVIADLTGQNANVFYELGIAHSFKDSHHIILISQNESDIPFDIRHLNAIIYSPDNTKYLTSNILKSIRDNRHQFEFFEALQRNSIIGMINDDKKEFVDVFVSSMEGSLGTVTAILNGEFYSCSNDQVKHVLDATRGLIYSCAPERNIATLRGLVNILSGLLCGSYCYEYSLEVVKNFLYENKLENYSLQHSEIRALQSQLAVNLATKRVFQNIALVWIVEYFSRSKSSTVDLNRYWMERFLLTSTDPEVDEAIVNSVLHENNYVREHMADLIGEKNLQFGRDTLIAQLGREGNIFTTASIITALGKLADPVGYLPIVYWFEKNCEDILQTRDYFVLKRIGIAFKKMGISNEFTKKFEVDFAEHLIPSAVF